jgi:hypothetical protein
MPTLDVLEVVISENPLELVFNDAPLEVYIQEDNFDIVINTVDTEIIVQNDSVEILTIAEQGPAGILGIAIGNTAPSAPVLGALWLDTH